MLCFSFRRRSRRLGRLRRMLGCCHANAISQACGEKRNGMKLRWKEGSWSVGEGVEKIGKSHSCSAHLAVSYTD